MRSRSETISLPANVFTILRELIKERLGLLYDDEKREFLRDKLSDCVLARGFESFLDYYYLLKYGPGAEEEWLRVMDALSVQETYFWREIEHVRALVDVILPECVKTRKGPIRIWSAACATGEEPLTIALALEEAGWFEKAPIEVVASDGSSAAIDKARRGLFRERSFRNLSPSLRNKYFEVASDGLWQIDRNIHARVKWQVANLMESKAINDLCKQSTVIFCRNVFIYFSQSAIAKTLQMFAQGIARPGWLFVGVSESLMRMTTDFELKELGGTFLYSKE